MASTNRTLERRVQSAFEQLSAASDALNSAAGELGKTVEALDSALGKLNLGIAAWVPIYSHDYEDGTFRNDQVGYSKVEGRWGIALRVVSGTKDRPDRDAVEQWLFNEAPRNLRVEALKKLPDLLDTLTRAADATTKRILDQLERARAMAGIVNQRV